MEKNLSQKATSSTREISFSRTFPFPPEKVFRAWSSPHALENWWGPDGFTTSSLQMNFTPGGGWSFHMFGPDGTDYENYIHFLEIESPRRLVYDHGVSKNQPAEFRTRVQFERKGQSTHLTITMEFPTEEICEEIKRQGAENYGAQSLAHLERYLEMLHTDYDVVFTERLLSPRELVYEVWTHPEHINKWWGPHGFTNPVCEVDVRPRGEIHIDMKAPDGILYPCEGRFQEVTPLEKLVFTSAALDENKHPLFEVLNTVTFTEIEHATLMILHAQVLASTPKGQEYLRGQEEGWGQSLDKLKEYLTHFPHQIH